jgi:hypothetical protein
VISLKRVTRLSLRFIPYSQGSEIVQPAVGLDGRGGEIHQHLGSGVFRNHVSLYFGMQSAAEQVDAYVVSLVSISPNAFPITVLNASHVVRSLLSPVVRGSTSSMLFLIRLYPEFELAMCQKWL